MTKISKSTLAQLYSGPRGGSSSKAHHDLTTLALFVLDKSSSLSGFQLSNGNILVKKLTAIEEKQLPLMMIPMKPFSIEQ